MPALSDDHLQGLVVSSYGKRYEVELVDKKLADQKRINCVTRGKKNDIACGDQVIIKLTGKSQGVIESIVPRTSLLYRSNAFKSKILAANVTQIVIVLATQPSFYEGLLNRCLVAAEAAHIKPLIVLNKCDLADESHAKDKLKLYSDLGYEVVHVSAKESIDGLRQYLNNHRSVLVGQSGMGKSTMVNALFPELNIRTQQISTVLDSGKHTTTATHLYNIDKDSSLIDSPGLQEFGLNHLTNEQLELAFMEFRPYLGKCRFNNCKHSHEPDCAVLAAVENGSISTTRLDFYKNLSSELF